MAFLILVIRKMEKDNQPKYMTQTLYEWVNGSCLYLSEAESRTQTLYKIGRVHTPVFAELYTYERKYIVQQMAKEGF